MSRYVDISPYEKCSIVSNPEDNGFPVSQLITIDAEPVRHGRWITYRLSDFSMCSCCEELTFMESNYHYCPNCGAKMENGGSK